MQSEKLPKMPLNNWDLTEVSRVHPKETITQPLFTYQQMQEYALAARKIALEEVFLESHRRFLSNYKQSDPYQQGCCHEMMFFELWLKDLMEQDV